jgi:hypothetical protein
LAAGLVAGLAKSLPRANPQPALAKQSSPPQESASHQFLMQRAVAGATLSVKDTQHKRSARKKIPASQPVNFTSTLVV